VGEEVGALEGVREGVNVVGEKDGDWVGVAVGG